MTQPVTKTRKSHFGLVIVVSIACTTPKVGVTAQRPQSLPTPVSAELDSALRVPCEATIRRAAAAGQRIYRHSEVTVPADLIFENKGPKYPDPEKLESATVQTEFVVDSLGRADMTTFRPLRPVPANFLLSVLDYLPHAKYKPARIDGHGVAQCALQSFEFVPANRERRN